MLTLRVRSVTYEAEGILSFDLVDPQGATLPPFEAGAHIDIKTPGGLSRRYSLCNAPGNVDHYRIAVLHAPNSRGGSRAMHERVRREIFLRCRARIIFSRLICAVTTPFCLPGELASRP